jgi:hypothetical protein
MIDDGWDRPGFASTKKEAGPAPPLSHTLHSSLKASNTVPSPKNDEDRESKVKGYSIPKKAHAFLLSS